jgi:hypothetical protein
MGWSAYPASLSFEIKLFFRPDSSNFIIVSGVMAARSILIIRYEFNFKQREVFVFAALSQQTPFYT